MSPQLNKKGKIRQPVLLKDTYSSFEKTIIRNKKSSVINTFIKFCKISLANFRTVSIGPGQAFFFQ